jgi:hypothetical protein
MTANDRSSSVRGKAAKRVDRQARGMHDSVDRAERSARGANKFGRRPGLREISCGPFDLSAGTPALHAHRLQPLEPRPIGPLPMQHQAVIPAASRRATAAPIPDPPPVTMETRMRGSWLSMEGL